MSRTADAVMGIREHMDCRQGTQAVPFLMETEDA